MNLEKKTKMMFKSYGFYVFIYLIMTMELVEYAKSQEQSSNSSSWFNYWSAYSYETLETVEKSILSHLKTPYKGFFVNIGPIVGDQDDKIWTITLNIESNNTPILMLHGLASGVGLWVLNLDEIAEHRPLYAIDVLGFGRSSRPKFDADPQKAEKQFVESIEEWRKKMKLEEFILLGHSFGGYLASSYSLSYPTHVKHLIFADPWGFHEKPKENTEEPKFNLFVRLILTAVKPLNPLWALRLAGPFGSWLVEKTRPDILKKFSSFVTDVTLIPTYIHQCNAQEPSGESAFRSMMAEVGWANHPMINRIEHINQSIPITFLYGENSWIDHNPGYLTKNIRNQSYVNIEIIPGAGHHVYADRADIFDDFVNKACFINDHEQDLLPLEKASGDKE